MVTVLITGGTGMIGTALSKMLVTKGYNVIILTRQSSVKLSQLSFEAASISVAQWNIEDGTIDKDAIERADYTVHLAGANVEKRWTEKRKKEIVDSRVNSGELLVKSLREIPNNVKAVLSASGIGWYGEDDRNHNFYKGGNFKEDAPAANDFLGQTCERWERVLQPVQTLSKRLVIFRQGVVLSNEGGALPEFKKPLKFGISPILGNGKQIMSWIHIDDLCRMYIYAIENNLNGVFNAIAPEPVSNKVFTSKLAKLKGKIFIPIRVPSFVLKAVLGEMSVEVLKSATVSSEKIRSRGFKFLYPSIDEALKNL